MSLFLGKIHYWLFNKIKWFEELENEVIIIAQNEELHIEDINMKYGEKLLDKNLEDIIDTSNIHGWLQDKIHSSEGRMAALTSTILKKDENFIYKIEEIYSMQGIKAAKEIKDTLTYINAKEIYRCINDYILDGMPCDRVNEIEVSEEDIIKWNRRVCVHKEIWEKENIKVSVFYSLRDKWIESFVKQISNEYEYIKLSEDSFCIKKR